MSRRNSAVSVSSSCSRPRSAAHEASPSRRRSSIFGSPWNPQGFVVAAKDVSDVTQLKTGDAFYKTIRRYPSVTGLAEQVFVTAATNSSSGFSLTGSLSRSRRSVTDHRPSIGAIVENVSLESSCSSFYRYSPGSYLDLFSLYRSVRDSIYFVRKLEMVWAHR